MKVVSDLVVILERLRNEYGSSIFERALKEIHRHRIYILEREKRKRFPWSTYVKLYTQQKGICLYCQKDMMLLKGEVEVDHRDPNRKDFNTLSNLQLLHRRCNRQKGSSSIPRQAKQQHKTYVELLT